MKVALANVISLNGKITAGSNPNVQDWASNEDAVHFSQLRGQSDVIIMGRRTYEAVRPTPDASKLRMIITRTPNTFENLSRPGAIEFTNSSPQRIIGTLAARGYTSALVAGGGEINALFLDAGLVDDLYLTIEPIVFGSGTDFAINSANLQTELSLQSIRQLNDRGTLLAHYAINHM